MGICGGGRHSLAVLCNDRGVHEIHAFGRGDDGQLGLSDISSQKHPNKIATSRLGNTVLAISAGWSHSVAVFKSLPSFQRQPTLLQETQGVMRQMFHSTAWFSKGDLDGLAAQLLGGITQYMLLLKVLPTNCGIDTDMVRSIRWCTCSWKFTRNMVYSSLSLSLMNSNVKCVRIDQLYLTFFFQHQQVLSKVMPPMALSYLLGNVLFGLQGLFLMQKENRFDVTAQISGVSIVMFYAFALQVMQPAYDEALDEGHSEKEAGNIAWRAGIFANFMCGLCQALSVLAINTLRSLIPREAMLAAVAGVSMTFITMDFMFQIFNAPSYALFPALFMVICAGSNINLPWNLPVGFVSLIIGTSSCLFTII